MGGAEGAGRRALPGGVASQGRDRKRDGAAQAGWAADFAVGRGVVAREPGCRCRSVGTPLRAAGPRPRGSGGLGRGC